MLLIMKCCTSFLSRKDHRSDVVLSLKTYLSYDYFIFSSLLFICSKLNFGRLAGWSIAELTPWETILELDQPNIGPNITRTSALSQFLLFLLESLAAIFSF